MSTLRRYSQLVAKLLRIVCSSQSNKEAEYRRVIFYTLKDWGGVYIKFLQIMASNNKFMEGWGGPQEMEVFSQAPYEDIDLQDYLNLSNFTEISPKPVAAGSFALVYRGRLTTGEDVAIKILRPSIEKNLEHDLAVLRHLCKFFARFLPRSLINYDEAYAACAKMFMLETNYEREIANQSYFAKFYQNHPRIVIPRVYPHLSSKYVIIQDFIAGPTLADIMASATPSKPATQLTQELTGSDLWQQIITVGGEALYTAMRADYVYGDPHPGNIILLPNNRVALIDFGIIANKPTSHRAYYNWVQSYYNILNGTSDFNRLFETTIICFCPDLALAMQRCNFHSDNLLSALTQSAETKLAAEIDKNTSYLELFRDGHLMNIFMNTIRIQAINIKIDMVNFELLKAMQAFLGSITILDNSEGEHSFAKVMQRSMEYALTNTQNKDIPSDDIRISRYSLTESYELLVQTISALADHDEIMFNLVQERIFA